MEEEMKPYYAPGYSGHGSIKTTMLMGGRQKHTMEGWVGYSNPNQGMNKVKWRRTDVEYYEVNGYTLTRNGVGKLTCQCKGFQFRKRCKHITEVQEGTCSRDVNTLFTEGELQEHQEYLTNN